MVVCSVGTCAHCCSISSLPMATQPEVEGSRRLTIPHQTQATSDKGELGDKEGRRNHHARSWSEQRSTNFWVGWAAKLGEGPHELPMIGAVQHMMCDHWQLD